MKNLSEIKGVCLDFLRYGGAVAINRYKYDNAKAKGQFDQEVLQKLHKGILTYLRRKYHGLLKKYQEYNLPPEGITTQYRNTIWCFWWQGIENAPDLVQTCVDSIRMRNPQCNVVLLDKNNYDDYVDFPAYILAKLHSDQISYTLFSDILRFKLLSKYGGIWMDATIFCVGPLRNEYYISPFFTARTKEKISECIANYRWTCYLMAGNANHIVFKYMADFFDCYFAKEPAALHYFLVDYALCLAYENIPQVRKALEAIPCNNEKRSELAPHLGDTFTAAYTTESLYQNADFYKLFWKINTANISNNGQKTVWEGLKEELRNPNHGR